MKKTAVHPLIRPYRISEYEAVVSLWKKVNLPFKPRGRDTRKNIEREISRTGTAIFLVAEIDQGIIGTVLGTHDGRKGWINRLAVHPDYRHRGIATELVSAIEKRLHKIGIHIIACLIEDPNRDSMKFFEKIGYIKHPDIFYFSKRKHPST